MGPLLERERGQQVIFDVYVIFDVVFKTCADPLMLVVKAELVSS